MTQETLFPSHTKETTYSCPNHPDKECRYRPYPPDLDPYQDGLSPWERLRRRGFIPGEGCNDKQA